MTSNLDAERSQREIKEEESSSAQARAVREGTGVCYRIRGGLRRKYPGAGTPATDKNCKLYQIGTESSASFASVKDVEHYYPIMHTPLGHRYL